ncbi:hypothetical protein N4R57_08960 [Rhodobacteraceae bacterium D3-12]|nr:hypothetical protein N4R57_08960 [Rhodobacteraceae bacterium D3-12]
MITLVIITQKPSVLNSVDKIMLMADGGITMFGYRQQVLEALQQRRHSVQVQNANPNNQGSI